MHKAIYFSTFVSVAPASVWLTKYFIQLKAHKDSCQYDIINMNNNNNNMNNIWIMWNYG